MTLTAQPAEASFSKDAAKYYLPSTVIGEQAFGVNKACKSPTCICDSVLTNAKVKGPSNLDFAGSIRRTGSRSYGARTQKTRALIRPRFDYALILKKGSRSSDQRKAAPAAAVAHAATATGAATNKRHRVRREKLGERIIALQQLVSPFGKSDTASVLHEALGYIRFLHDQVQALSSPYMQRLPASVHAPAQEGAAGTVVEPPRASDLRSRGLCLVPISCTEHVAGGGHGHGNGADLWSVAARVENKGAAAGTLPGAGGHPGYLA
ncbi:uncharacterized protein LOC120690033 isoform X3 [Panicum virgatum]|uniref:uncharacterized protein LOC120690033 isoform X3 n=1 Tax=Panicum virgatum TaxID=38727 RepID=UPI0019D61C1D|nr:uncharacterized protein LOC120690033 isoform X3 [Panicum virgatum]